MVEDAIIDTTNLALKAGFGFIPRAVLAGMARKYTRIDSKLFFNTRIPTLLSEARGRCNNLVNVLVWCTIRSLEYSFRSTQTYDP